MAVLTGFVLIADGGAYSVTVIASAGRWEAPTITVVALTVAVLVASLGLAYRAAGGLPLPVSGKRVLHHPGPGAGGPSAP